MPFQKGKSGNPRGRPKLTDAQREARKMLEAASPKAVSTLVAQLDDDDKDLAQRAAIAILKKTVPDGLELSDHGGGSIFGDATVVDLVKLALAKAGESQ